MLKHADKTRFAFKTALVGLLVFGGAQAFCAGVENVHSAVKTVPVDLRRIAVLPLTSERDYDLEEGSRALSTVLIEELIKTKKFEVVRVSPDTLKSGTGRVAWSGEDALPANFFNALSNAYGCDAVLFAQLTTFRPYAPMAVGWRFKLVNITTGQILWAADETFDSGEPDVVSAAKRFARQELGARMNDDGWKVLHSPRCFGRYSVASLLTLLPER